MLILWKLITALISLRYISLLKGNVEYGPTAAPANTWVNAGKETFLTDFEKCLILRVTVTGDTMVYFGKGNDTLCQSTGDGGPATLADGRPYHLCGDSRTGDVYFTDYSSRVLRKISADGGIVSTAAGSAFALAEDESLGSRYDKTFDVDENDRIYYPPTEVLATAHKFALPSLCWVDAEGDVFIVDSGAGSIIVKLTTSTGMLSVPPTHPLVAVDEDENLNYRIDATRKLPQSLLRGSVQ